MRALTSLALISLMTLQTACSEESVAEKYLATAPAAEGTDPEPTDPDPTDPDPAEGDAAAGQALMDSNCMACHNASTPTVLGKGPIGASRADKIKSVATERPGEHSSYADLISENIADLEAAAKAIGLHGKAPAQSQ